ncbi:MULTISPECIES: flagellar filament capping protein FliD [Halomonadaceae]|uniref:Flagellar hook-associated protein 2 n=1 Tax=Vreelandella titanicae TaxID=664683 RepID=A0AAP9NMX7_9GAMM|nr:MULTISPECIES: flagellar filament capping protein FliD [Halomonas]QKS25288.1 Flagellar hook-associated protein 2 [Halomonas titanicae]CDG53561.1 Flagellar capping protein [Halomonas sp. A3H3]SDJ20673.1 flagellar hook-associated protein 2 [Halomonas titanicae]|eukprot:TRINITY_DN67793_c0_g1_i1.p2 TRINITY_DN67793_c0_g1~~TRINITY_DN67793_c0_g1_i1.p2  ORF type:complete len:449 (-),score=24.89 TRINITY_DN67793_c0_g1_i1:1646-2992(-)
MASITSLGIGSGLDLNGLLDQLKEAEEEKLVPILKQQETQQTKISAYGQLQSALSTFQDAADALNDSTLYESLSTNVDGEAITATADGEAQPGSYNVIVDTLATRGTLASDGVTAADEAITTADQTLTLNFADGSTQEIDIASGSTLEDIRDTINATEGSGVNATIVNDGTNFRLALSSSETGADESINNFSFDGAAPFAADTANTRQLGTDAALTVNGIDITSSTNQVEGAIQGVTLNLQEEGESTVNVEQNTLKVREAVTGFVNAYNDLKDKIGDLTSFNSETGEAGELLGDSAVRTVESRMRIALSSGSDGQFSVLSDIGISLKRDGQLEIDSDELDNAIVNNQGALSEFFAGGSDETGMAGQINTTIEQLLSSNGRVSGAITGAENRKASLVEQYARTEQSIESTMSRYRTQFGQLDGMIAQMNQTSSYLTQQFDALDAQLGRD